MLSGGHSCLRTLSSSILLAFIVLAVPGARERAARASRPSKHPRDPLYFLFLMWNRLENPLTRS